MTRSNLSSVIPLAPGSKHYQTLPVLRRNSDIGSAIQGPAIPSPLM